MKRRRRSEGRKEVQDGGLPQEPHQMKRRFEQRRNVWGRVEVTEDVLKRWSQVI